jgi:putative transcriptional regulator
MGLIVNKRMDEVTFAELLEQLEIERPDAVRDVPVCYGGPVELRRGFVLHSSDYAPRGEEGLEIDDRFSMTATLDVLEDIANGRGPRQALAGAGLCRVGARSAGGRDRRQWLADGRGRAGPRVRIPAMDGKWEAALAVNRDPPADAVVGGRARLTGSRSVGRGAPEPVVDRASQSPVRQQGHADRGAPVRKRERLGVVEHREQAQPASPGRRSPTGVRSPGRPRSRRTSPGRASPPRCRGTRGA